MHNADSLLAAAKRVAEKSGLEWSYVQRFYRALQGAPNKGDGWLPRSLGRNIWAAHPNYVSRLLVALAAADDPSDSIAAVKWAQGLTPNGRDFYLTERPAANVICPFEYQMSAFLTDASKAGDLVSVEFQRDRDTAIFNLRDGQALVFSSHPEADPQTERPATLVQKRGLISGDLFRALCEEVSWRQDRDAPLTKVAQGEVGEDD